MPWTPAGRPTLVALHAHPDDESIFTGGLLARAARSGWRTVVVLATSGEAGSVPGYEVDDTGAHRRAEAAAACAVLGVDRLVLLPFTDSGMLGRAAGDRRLAGTHPLEVVEAIEAVLEGESPSVVTTYDEHGIYGHPDHVAVHCVGRLLADAGVAVYEATLDRRHLGRMRDELIGRRVLAPWRWPLDLTGRLGIDGDDELLHLDLEPDGELAVKRAALAAHASQVTFAPEFMGIPPGAFHRLLAHEWFLPAGRRCTEFEELVAGKPVQSLAAVGGRLEG